MILFTISLGFDYFVCFVPKFFDEINSVVVVGTFMFVLYFD